MALNEKGQEIPDPTPVEIPLKFQGNYESLHEKILRYVRSEQFRQKMEEEGFETEEEANDFDVGDEDGELPLSYAERAVLMAEELEVRKKEILDMEGKKRYNGGKEVANERSVKGSGSKDEEGQEGNKRSKGAAGAGYEAGESGSEDS